MDFGTIFIIVIVFLFLLGYKGLEEQKKEENKLQKKIKSIRDFNPTKRILSDYKHNGILIDDKRHKIGFIHGVDNIKIYGFKDILAAELVENGKSLMKTSGTSMAGRALLGGVLLGPLGAVIGGVTGKKHQEDVIDGVNLLITLNDPNNPIFTYKFLADGSGVQKDNLKYGQAIENARKWHAYIKIAIERAEEHDTQIENGFNAEYEIDKVEFLQNAIGTREKYHNTVHNTTFNKIEKDILLQASVNINKENPDQSLIERAYNILSTHKSNKATSESQEETIQTQILETSKKQMSSNHSVADEIIKLKSLKDKGILSEEEFMLQKNKLLQI